MAQNQQNDKLRVVVTNAATGVGHPKLQQRLCIHVCPLRVRPIRRHQVYG